MKLIGFDGWPTRARRPQPARIERRIVTNKLREERITLGILDRLLLAARFVGWGHQQKRRMIAMGSEDAICLLIHPFVDRQSATGARRLIGPGSLHLQIDSRLVGRAERSLRWTVAVETKMV